MLTTSLVQSCDGRIELSQFPFIFFCLLLLSLFPPSTYCIYCFYYIKNNFIFGNLLLLTFWKNDNSHFFYKVKDWCSLIPFRNHPKSSPQIKSKTIIHHHRQSTTPPSIPLFPISDSMSAHNKNYWLRFQVFHMEKDKVIGVWAKDHRLPPCTITNCSVSMERGARIQTFWYVWSIMPISSASSLIYSLPARTT